MRECILHIFWPRNDIVEFFADHGCTKKDLKTVRDFKENGLSRAKIVDMMFSYLSSRPDEGLGQFRAMLQSLLRWDHFDPYYFDNLQKLKREDAEHSLEHLRQLEEIRDAKIHEARKKREQLEKESQRPQQTLKELNHLFHKLFTEKEARQQRGYDLEGILQELY